MTTNITMSICKLVSYRVLLQFNQAISFVDRDMYMRYHGGGIGHYRLTIPDDSEPDSESESSESENSDTGASDAGTGTDSDAGTTSDDEEDSGEQVPEDDDDFNDEENLLGYGAL